MLFSITAYSQTNLLSSSNGADRKNGEWQAIGDAKIEEFGNTKRFVVRNGGSFVQQIKFPEESTGKYLLLIGSGSSERVFSNNNTTDHAYLFGFIWDDQHITNYLQGQSLLWDSKQPNEWMCLSGIFQIPEKSVRFSVHAGQAAKKGTAQKGAPARFDNLGAFIFDDQASAELYAEKYCSQLQ